MFGFNCINIRKVFLIIYHVFKVSIIIIYLIIQDDRSVLWDVIIFWLNVRLLYNIGPTQCIVE